MNDADSQRMCFHPWMAFNQRTWIQGLLPKRPDGEIFFPPRLILSIMQKHYFLERNGTYKALTQARVSAAEYIDTKVDGI